MKQAGRQLRHCLSGNDKESRQGSEALSPIIVGAGLFTVHPPPPTTTTTTKRVLLPSESSADGDVATTSELRSPLLLALLAKKEAAEAAKGTGIKLPIKDQWTRKDRKTLARLEEKEKELARLANDEEALAAQVEQLNRKKKLPTGLKKTIKGKERIWEWILDIETSDPDDIMMLLFATAHPLIGSNLKAVTITLEVAHKWHLSDGSEKSVCLTQLELRSRLA